jgi:hypothetical protein
MEVPMRWKLIIGLSVLIAVTMAVFPIVAFRVTGASVSVSEPEYRGFCPHRFIFTGRITTNREGTVRYRWRRSDGSGGAEQTLAFAAAGTKTVSTYWEMGGTMGTYSDRWMQIEVLAPNPLASNRAKFDLVCLPQMRMEERKPYKVSGRIITGGQHVEWLNGLQLKVMLMRGARRVSTCTATFNRDGICPYSLVVFNAPGSYRVTVETVHPTDPDLFYLCFDHVDPAFIAVTLTEEAPEAINKNFNLTWGWRHLGPGEESFPSPCW